MVSACQVLISRGNELLERFMTVMLSLPTVDYHGQHSPHPDPEAS